MVSGGMSTLGSLPDGQEFSNEEIEACMDEAHRAGRPVCAHIHGGPGLKVAVDAGVDTVEHGALLKEDEVEYLAKHDVWLVSTDGVGQVAAELADAPEHYKCKAKAGQEHRLNVRRWAKSYGVKVAVGTDTNHARMDMEMQALVDAGWAPMEAIQALTLRGAELLGMQDEIGTLAEGKFADIIAVQGDPLGDPSVLGSVRFVMKSGVVYRQDA
jgi:imidazolonepropionase-like amidohydrolase